MTDAIATSTEQSQEQPVEHPDLLFVMDVGRPNPARNAAGLFGANPASLVHRERGLNLSFDFRKLEVVAHPLPNFRFGLHAKTLHE